MVFHWPQITLLALTFLSIGINMNETMTKKTTEARKEFLWNFGAQILQVALLYFGGFFNGTSP